MKQYWYCVVGPVEASKVPEGGDYPMRIGVRKGMELIQDTFKDEDVKISSGWGITEEEWMKIQKILNTSAYFPE